MAAARNDNVPFYARFASNRAALSLSYEKLRRYQPEAFGLRGLFWSIRKRARFKWLLGECPRYGDARAAVVISVEPLLVAAYSDDFDAVLMLRFPSRLVADFSLVNGKRLISANAYGPALAADINWGPNARSGNWGNFVPTIAEFFSDDARRIEYLHSTIMEAEWDRCARLGAHWVSTQVSLARDGLPLHADRSTL